MREVVRAVERRAVSRDTRIEATIVETSILIDAGMNDDHIARLHARRKRVGVIGLGRAHVVRRQQARERGLLLRALVACRIDVIDMPVVGSAWSLPL